MLCDRNETIKMIQRASEFGTIHITALSEQK